MLRSLPEPALDFETYARFATARLANWLGGLTLLACLGWWPLDYVLYAGEPELIAAFRTWRIGITVTTAVALIALRLLPEHKRGVHLVVAASIALSVAVLGYAVAAAGDRSVILMQGSALLIPFTSGVLMVGAPARAIATLVISGSFLTGLLLVPSKPPHIEHLATHLSLMTFTVVASVMIGHGFYRLVARFQGQEAILAERSRELEELDRIKNDFFANISHELRTPLTLVLAMIGELREVSTDPRVRTRIDTAERNAARLLVMIDELLALARFTAGRAAPNMQHVDAAQLTREVVANFRPSETEDESLRITGCDAPVWIEADPRQLRTALHNLLSNAFKFTEPESRRIAVSLDARADTIELVVSDNGAGIPGSVREKVFERFYQVEAGRDRRRGGAGIGLALVSEVVRAHGGRVELESEVGRGSAFRLVLPVGDPRAAEASGLAPDPLAELHAKAMATVPEPPPAEVSDIGATLLVAEDDAELRAYLSRVLGRHYRVIAAANGAEALSACEQVTPALVVTDVMMPGMSGLELARRLRDDERTARVPVLFLTARSGTAARVEAFEAGADDYLHKPFDAEELLLRVRNLLELRHKERELTALNETLEQKVADRTRRLRQLARHLERSREDERRRIARDLHDETGQLLTALRLELDEVREAIVEPAGVVEILNRMDELLEQTFAATRALVGELRPRILDDLGLGAAVEWYLSRFEARASLSCTWSIEPRGLTAAPDVSTAAFRILQEALTNVTRHALATAVKVRLRGDGERLTLEVIDDGRGFDAASAQAGYGLLGMRERAASLDGRLEITSRRGEGTRLRLTLPIAVVEQSA